MNQINFSDKSLRAFCASVLPHSQMTLLMLLQIHFQRERSGAFRAFERIQSPGMASFMYRQTGFPGKSRGTLGAFVRFFARVQDLMLLQTFFGGESGGTLLALMGFETQMRPLIPMQISFLAECGRASLALIGLQAKMGSLVFY